MIERIPLGFSLLRRDFPRTIPSGRFISESATPPDILMASKIPMEYTLSPYADHRAGHLHNASALAEIKQEWKSRLAGLAWIRNHFYEGTPHPPNHASLNELDQMARIALVMPLFLQYRAENPYPPQGAIPDVVGDMTKLAAGIVTTTTRLMEDGIDLDNRDLTGKATYHYTDSHRLLTGSDGRACPANPEMIIRSFDVLISGRDDLPDSNLNDYFPNFPSLRAFSTAYTGFLETRLLIDTMLSSIDGKDYGRRKLLISEMLSIMQERQNDLYQTLGYDPSDHPVLHTEDIQAFFISKS
jgi:hypothetical protein